MSGKCTKLHVLSVGIALGVMWGLGILALGLISWLTGWGDKMVELMASMYIGYDDTLGGSFIGAIWGFVDAFIGGVVFAWLYNLCLAGCCKYCPSSKEACK